MKKDIRWQQRFQNYCNALTVLENCIMLIKKTSPDLLEFAELSLIKAFEFVYELSWNCMKDICEKNSDGQSQEKPVIGSKDAIYFAEKIGLISNKALWDDIIQSRIKTVHTYHEKTARDIAKKIVSTYYPEFVRFREKLKTLKT